MDTQWLTLGLTLLLYLLPWLVVFLPPSFSGLNAKEKQLIIVLRNRERRGATIPGYH